MADLCEYCGADKQAWLKTFGELHNCAGVENESNRQVHKVLNALRRHGVNAFLPGEILDSDFEDLIQGHD